MHQLAKFFLLVVALVVLLALAGCGGALGGPKEGVGVVRNGITFDRAFKVVNVHFWPSNGQVEVRSGSLVSAGVSYRLDFDHSYVQTTGDTAPFHITSDLPPVGPIALVILVHVSHTDADGKVYETECEWKYDSTQGPKDGIMRIIPTSLSLYSEE